MKEEQIEAFYALTRSVRKLFHRLGHGVEALLADSDVSAGMRAILETLTERGPMTVPEMARIRPVTRQHIQSLVNPLLEQGYVEAIDNPVHKRSKLIKVTAKGENGFRKMRTLENEAFRQLDLDVGTADFRSANRVLEKLIAVLDGPSWQEIVARRSNRSSR